VQHQYQRHLRQIVTGINDTSGKFATDGKQWKQYQTAQLKVNLKEKMYLYANSTTSRCPKEIIKNFSD
jgi:hypothetical protein